MGCGCSLDHRTSAAVNALFLDEDGTRRSCDGLVAVRILSRQHPHYASAQDVLARAFCGTTLKNPDPSYGWVYSGSAKGIFAPLPETPSEPRLNWFRWLCGMVMGWGLNRGGIYAILDPADDALVAVAVTAPPGSPAALNVCEEVSLFAKHGGLPPRNDSDGSGVMRRADTLERELQRLHKRIVPSGNDLRVAMVACDPEKQSRGFGTALLRLIGKIADADGVATYLETSGARNEEFYARKGGFEVMARTTVTFGTSEIVEAGMLRRARVRDAPEATANSGIVR